MSLDKPLRIVLFRHGETKYNLEKRLQSPKDCLTEKGKMQVKASLNSLSKYNFDRILSSDELRAIETSMIVSKSLNSDFETLSLIREKSSGDFSDKLVSEVDWSIVKGSFLEKKIPHGESIREVIVRALEFFKIINEYTQGKEILIISHGTFLRILLCLIVNFDIEDTLINYEFPNSEYIVINRSSSGRWILEKNPLIKK